jgi:hypothetical protein
MANIRTLSVSVKARTKGFQQGMRRAGRTVKRFGTTVRAATMKIGAFGAGLATLAAGGSLVVLVKRSYKTMDAMSKMADKIGVTTEELAGLQYAAQRTGVGTEGMNASLARFSRRIGLATRGAGAAVKVFQHLKLSPEEMAQKGTTESLKMFSDAIQKLPTHLEKNAAAFEAFGNAGQAMLPILLSGREGIEKYMKRAEALGLTFDRLGGAKIEIVNDKFTDLTHIFIGASNVLAQRLAPYIGFLADHLVDAAMQGKNLGNQLVDAMKRAALAMARAIEWVQKLRSELSLVVIASGEMTQRILRDWKRKLTIGLLVAPVVGLRGFQGPITKAIAEIDEALKGLDERTKGWYAHVVELMKDFYWGLKQSGLKKFFEDLEKSWEDAARKAIGQPQAGALAELAGVGRNATVRAREFNPLVQSLRVPGLEKMQRREQRVRDPQLGTTNKVLKNIQRQLQGGRTAVAG